MARTADERRDALDRGARAEECVAAHLSQMGWDIVARNWRGGGGEIDLIARRGGGVRFVEVKGRSDDGYDPLEAVNVSKQRLLARAAEAWLVGNTPAEEACFLVAIVDFTDWSVDLIDNAFDS